MNELETKTQETSAELGGAKKVAKKVVKKKAAAKAEKPAAKSNGDVVTVAQLAKQAKIEPSAARARLRKAEIENPGRWEFKKGSGAEKAARKAIGIE
jgi:hypothetical protein